MAKALYPQRRDKEETLFQDSIDMEDKEDIKEILQQEQTKEEKPDQQDEANHEETKEEKSEDQNQANQEEKVMTNVKESNNQNEVTQEERVIPMLEESQLPDGKKEEILENVAEVGADTQTLQAKKVEEIQKDSSKKPRQDSKPNLRAKSTVPRPFSLATEKRMSRERRASMDFSSVTEKRLPRERRGSMDVKDAQNKLSKSISLINYKAQPSLNSGETSNPRRANPATAATKTSSRPKVTTSEHVDKRVENGLKTKDKIQVKEAESRSLQVTTKKMQGEESDNSKLRKSSTFKASPLPSFYHRKDPPSKPETKKIPLTRPKSPVLGRRSKLMPDDEKILKVEEKGKKVEGRGSSVSKTITNSAKETINKLLKSTKKALGTSK